MACEVRVVTRLGSGDRMSQSSAPPLPRLAWTAFGLVFGLAACVGNIGSSDDATGPPGGSTSASCSDVQLAPMRRLSRAEYLASVRDLFPGVELGELAIGRDP